MIVIVFVCRNCNLVTASSRGGASEDVGVERGGFVHAASVCAASDYAEFAFACVAWVRAAWWHAALERVASECDA